MSPPQDSPSPFLSLSLSPSPPKRMNPMTPQGPPASDKKTSPATQPESQKLLAELKSDIQEARRRIHRVVKGQDTTLTLLFVALGARGHALLDGPPGVGKTTLSKTFAKVTGLEFKRVQMTTDLMPADITGYNVYNPSTGTFTLRKGPIFTNVLLADELNRTPPRTQASLLEVMQEQQATIEGETYPVPDPFLVLATKNPIETEGVYTLPEAELDRFLVSSIMGYPDEATEGDMVDAKIAHSDIAPVEPVPRLVERLRQAADRVRVHPDLRRYLIALVRATRDHPLLDHGASPRAAEHLLRAAQAHAALEGRAYVIPDDIRDLSYPVLAHRLLRSAQAEIDEVRPEEILDEILEDHPPPVKDRSHETPAAPGPATAPSPPR